jgi:uncharacterized damage-inducible protein DinB
MTTASPSLKSVYDGWDSHQVALVRAVTPLTHEQLVWRPAPRLSSLGELVSHIALARLWWFYKMDAPGSAELAREMASWKGGPVDAEDPAALQRWADALEKQEAAILASPAELLRWLDTTWQMIATTLSTWTVADLAQTYRHIYQQQVRAVSRQWTIWRILSHDLHHGGQLALLLGLQGIDVPDLGDRGGHLTEPPLAET